jgi:thioredoxin 1
MNFESHIKDHKPTVVEFYADWSKLSNLLVPVMHEVKETAGDRATVLRINIDHNKIIQTNTRCIPYLPLSFLKEEIFSGEIMVFRPVMKYWNT